MIDRDIHLARALIVEHNPLLRSVSAAQLRDVGVGHVAIASRVRDARLMLEREHFDIVLCSREFEGSEDSGQDLLDELRRERLLPHSTVFLMVTAEISYHQVVEAAEAALDGFLVRPYTTATLSARLLEARNRKRELGQVLRALDAGENENALLLAIKRFQERQPYWGYCGRLAAELLMGMQRPKDAQRLFERLLEVHPTAIWARLGLARSQLGQADVAGARKTVAAVLAEDPVCADAHDLMGRVLVEQSDFEGALVEYRATAELTPGCLLRAQHAGALAFYQGHREEAVKWLERTLNMGVQSKLFDALSLLLLAMLRHDRGDTAGVGAMATQLKRFRERFPDSMRLRRFEQTALALQGLLGANPAPALETLRELGAMAGHADFDLETANVLFALWARMPPAARPAAEHEAVIERVAMRFCISKAISESLVASARREEPALSLIRQSQARIAMLAQRAVETSLNGDAAAAARQLLAAGGDTLWRWPPRCPCKPGMSTSGAAAPTSR